MPCFLLTLNNQAETVYFSWRSSQKKTRLVSTLQQLLSSNGVKTTVENNSKTIFSVNVYACPTYCHGTPYPVLLNKDEIQLILDPNSLKAFLDADTFYNTLRFGQYVEQKDICERIEDCIETFMKRINTVGTLFGCHKTVRGSPQNNS